MRGTKQNISQEKDMKKFFSGSEEFGEEPEMLPDGSYNPVFKQEPDLPKVEGESSEQSDS